MIKYCLCHDSIPASASRVGRERATSVLCHPPKLTKPELKVYIKFVFSTGFYGYFWTKVFQLFKDLGRPGKFNVYLNSQIRLGLNRWNSFSCIVSIMRQIISCNLGTLQFSLKKAHSHAPYLTGSLDQGI